MGSPANLPRSFTVGSIDNNFMYSQLLQFNGKEFLIATPYDEAYAENAEVYYPEWAGTEENNRFLALGDFDKVDPKEVEGKIVVAYRGAGTFGDKYDNALRMGAAGLIVVESDDSTIPAGMTGINARDGKPVLRIIKSAGEELINYIRSTDTPTVTITKDKYSRRIYNTDTLSVFSSWGPSMDLSLKPDTAGPGGMITSLQNDNGYTTMGGTSMAAPHIAGGTAFVMKYKEKTVLKLH